MNTKVPAERFELGEDYLLPVRDLPVSVTSLIVGNKYLVDPSREEMSVGDTTLTITTDKDDNVVAMQKSGGYLLDEELFEELLDVSINCARKLREYHEGDIVFFFILI